VGGLRARHWGPARTRLAVASMLSPSAVRRSRNGVRSGAGDQMSTATSHGSRSGHSSSKWVPANGAPSSRTSTRARPPAGTAHDPTTAAARSSSSLAPPRRSSAMTRWSSTGMRPPYDPSNRLVNAPRLSA
jgi:hypothetical protein